MDNDILLTGATGFIGSNVARILAQKRVSFTVFVRPGTSAKKLQRLPERTNIVKIDLADTEGLRGYLAENRFSTVIHIGALRGGRNFPAKTYYDANVKATEQIADVCLKNDAKLIFCSSVGVYGAIPQELPAHINTTYQSDNFYHDTKIKAESIIQRYAIKGLKNIIIRPAITYGVEDQGFPYKLVKLVHKRLLFLPDSTIRIHLANIEIIADAFYKVAEDEFQGNRIYNIADRYPVKLNELVDFISNRLTGKPYPQSRYISIKHFRKMAAFCRRYGFPDMYNRIQLISNSWFYDSSEAFNNLYLRHAKTIPDFKTVVDWYKEHHRIRK